MTPEAVTVANSKAKGAGTGLPVLQQKEHFASSHLLLELSNEKGD